MTTQQKKRKDGELSSLLIASGVFTLGLIIVDFTYGNIHSLLSSWVVWPFTILHILLVAIWIVVLAKFNDPNYEYFRKWLFAINIAALLLILGHRSGFISEKMFKEDIKTKQEQGANK